jgi:signal recognition particle subunit SRP54
MMGMLPGVARMKDQLAAANLDERLLKRQMAAIDSMTPKERRNPDVLKASRKKRIAAGAGVKVEDINRMLKMHRQMADVMKMMGSGKRGALSGIANMLGLGGGSAMPTPEQMAELTKKMPGGGGGGLPPTMPPLPPKFPGSGPLLPGLGGAKPGLGGFPGLGKKK